MKSRIILFGMRSFAAAFSSFSVFPSQRPAHTPPARHGGKSQPDGTRRDREAIAGDWRRVGMDISDSAEKVMAGVK